MSAAAMFTAQRRDVRWLAGWPAGPQPQAATRRCRGIGQASSTQDTARQTPREGRYLRLHLVGSLATKRKGPEEVNSYHHQGIAERSCGDGWCLAIAIVPDRPA